MFTFYYTRVRPQCHYSILGRWWSWIRKSMCMVCIPYTWIDTCYVCIFGQLGYVNENTHPVLLARQCTAVCCGLSQCAACSVLHCVAVCCSVLQCVPECCSVLQCVAVCCSALQCVFYMPCIAYTLNPHTWANFVGDRVRGGERPPGVIYLKLPHAPPWLHWHVAMLLTAHATNGPFFCHTC